MTARVISIGHQDREWHEAFMRYVPQVFPRASFRRWYESGGWDDSYRAFAIAAGEEIIANASLQRMRLLLDGRELTGWQLGAVGVLREWRGRGLQREILPVLLASIPPEDFVFLFANDSVLDFYPKFGFQRVSESVFGADHLVVPSQERLRRLSLDHAQDRALLMRIAAHAQPVTRLFGARDYGRVLLWYWTNFYADAFFYSELDDGILVAEQDGDLLRICDVLAAKPMDLASCLPRIVTHTVRCLEFGFTPEQYWPVAVPLKDPIDSPLFVSAGHALPQPPFKFPVLAQT